MMVPKFLFRSDDGGASWILISATRLRLDPPFADVGDISIGGGVEALVFQTKEKGWMGLGGPGQNFFRSDDGGRNWTAVTGPPSGLAISSIMFTDPLHGTLTTHHARTSVDDIRRRRNVD